MRAAPAHAPARDAAPALSAATVANWEHGCFTLRTVAGLVETDHARCALDRRPYSTFKLANALIAVDAGVLDGPDAPMTWDRRAVPDERGTQTRGASRTRCAARSRSRRCRTSARSRARSATRA
jgi:beta-lactamase class D